MTPDEQKKLAQEITSLMEQQARYQREVSSSVEDYVAGVRKLKIVQKEVIKNKQLELDLIEEIAALEKLKDADGKKAAEIKLGIIKDQNKELEIQAKAIATALASVNKNSLMGARALGASVKALGSTISGLPGIFERGMGKLRNYGLFDMDKAMKKSALSMGVLSKQTDTFRGTIKNASEQTNMIGINIQELSEMQSVYSEELGRTVMLSEDALKSMSSMAVATGLGADGAARLAAEMENQGVSAERVAGYMQDALDKGHKLGINAAKTIKLVNGNLKMLNKYNFKNGVKGLTDMANLVAKLGVDMEFASGFADKLWNVEGAVDMGAQLQVMGGAWAQMADPFSLMYKARNDMKGLTEDIANAAAQQATFNKTTGEFDLAAAEMHKLKIIADQTGMSYDDLAKAGKNAAKFAKIKSQVNFSMNDEEKEFLSSVGKMDEKGRAFIEIKGDKKFLSQLSASDRGLIKSQIEEKQKMEDRAKQSITFDEKVDYLINQLKVYALPLVETLNTRLIPKIEQLSKRFVDEGWGDKIEKFAEVVGTVVSTVGEWILEWPRLSLGIFGLVKALPLISNIGSFFKDSITWFKNGKSLAAGFNSEVAIGGGTTGTGTPTTPGTTGRGGKWKSAGKGALAGLAVGGLNMAMAAANGEDAFNGENVGGLVGSVALGAIGTAFGGPIGGMIGATIGEAAGKYIGKSLSESENSGNNIPVGQEMHDGLFPALGSKYSKGRGILQQGKITPITNKDRIIAAEKGGPVEQALNGSSKSMNITFGTLIVDGKIEISSPGGPGVTIDITKNEELQREIARSVVEQMKKNTNLGKLTAG